MVGDEFTHRSYTDHYKLVTASDETNMDTQFMKENFELFEYSASRYSSLIHNGLGRVINQVGKAIKEQVSLPKVVLMVLDDDIIKQCDYPKQDGLAMD